MNEEEIKILKLYQWSFVVLCVGLSISSAYAISVGANGIAFLSGLGAVISFLSINHVETSSE